MLVVQLTCMIVGFLLCHQTQYYNVDLHISNLNIFRLQTERISIL
jgi:hypothetical protein